MSDDGLSPEAAKALENHYTADRHAWTAMMAAAEPISRDHYMGIEYPEYSLVPLEKLGDAKICEKNILALRMGGKYWKVDHAIYQREYASFLEGLESAPHE